MVTKNTNGIMKLNNYKNLNWVRFLLLCMLSLIVSTNDVQAQDTLIRHHVIEIKATNRNGDILKFKQLIKAAEAEELPEVVKHFKTARVYHVISNVIGLPGAFIVGYSLCSSITSPNGLNTQQLLLGLGMIGVHYTIAATLRDPQMKKGIQKYNEALYQKRLRMNEETEE
jgi:hypothetical protein